MPATDSMYEEYLYKRKKIEKALLKEKEEASEDDNVHQLQIKHFQEKLEQLDKEFKEEVTLRREAPALPVGYYRGTNKFGNEILIKVEEYTEPFYMGTKVQRWLEMVPREISWKRIKEDEYELEEKIDLF